jgi:hypothetical protein
VLSGSPDGLDSPSAQVSKGLRQSHQARPANEWDKQVSKDKSPIRLLAMGLMARRQ